LIICDDLLRENVLKLAQLEQTGTQIGTENGHKDAKTRFVPMCQ
jgi:hypothetical protein